MAAAVAVVAGVIGAVASGIGEAVGAVVGAIAGTAIGLSAASAVAMGIESLFFMDGLVAGLEAWATVAAIAEVILYKPPLKSAGSFQQFIADPQSPIPMVMGRFGTSGRAIYETSSGGGTQKYGSAGNQFITMCVILSGLGPIQDIEYFKANDTVLTLSNATPDGATLSGLIPAGTFTRFATNYTLDTGGNAKDNRYVNFLWMVYQLGAPGAAALQPTHALVGASAPLTEWDSTHKLTGFAASFYTCLFNSSIFAGQVPKPKWTLKGYPCYDPRQDSTYPGGSGSQRWATRSTWTWSQNPFIHALNFLLGFWYPLAAGGSGLYAGAGVPMGGVDVAAFVAAANVADANSWTIGGGWTTDDDKFNVFANMLAAGSGVPVIGGGQVSCMVNTPLTSIGPITQDELAGPVSIDTTTSMRDRINQVFPRFHSEPFDWDLITPLTPVTNSNYLADDGGRVRSKTITYEFVTQVNQAASLGAYDMANVREGIVATLPGKPCLGAYPVGSCVTVNLPQLGLNNFKAVVTKRQTNFQTGGVTLTVRSETSAKHAWALGQTLTAPPDPQIGGADVLNGGAPSGANWAAVGSTQTDSNGVTFPVITISGNSSDNPNADHVIFGYAPHGGSTVTSLPSVPAQDATTITQTITGLLNGAGYDIYIAYSTRGVLTPYLVIPNVIAGSFSVSTGGIDANAVTNVNAVNSLTGVAIANSWTSYATLSIPASGVLATDVFDITITAVWVSGNILTAVNSIGLSVTFDGGFGPGIVISANINYNQTLNFKLDISSLTSLLPAFTPGAAYALQFDLMMQSASGAHFGDFYIGANQIKR